VDLSGFTAIVIADAEFDFGGRDGNLPRVTCMVAKEILSGKTWRLWRDEIPPEPPFPIGADALFVSFTASAELGCFKVLGWPMPARILDLSAEYRNFRNYDYPRDLPKQFREKKDLIGACRFFGIDMPFAGIKNAIRRRILEGPPYTDEEREEILDYCAGDVNPLERLLAALGPHIDLPRALLRGRHEVAVAVMESIGVPIDVPTLTAFREHWTDIQDELIAKLDANFGVYEGRSFRYDRFVELLTRLGIIDSWPTLESGALDLNDRRTFRNMAKAHPVLAPLRELRHALSDLRIDALTVGEDGRGRTKLWPFTLKTSRGMPKPDEYIFGPSCWLRGLIKPAPGFGVAYIDYKTQEVGAAAAMSGDENMMADYLSEDMYIAFGIAAGILPKGANKDSHGPIREMLKQCVLGVQYGMGAETLARKIGCSLLKARSLLDAHRRRYKKFWRWSRAMVARAMQGLPLTTVFGWSLRPTADSRPTTFMNFLMQANAAEITRLACCLGIERGVRICAPVYDAVLIEAPLDRLEADIVTMRAAMAEASRIVLNGFELITECPDSGDFPQVIHHPNRFMDKRGAEMWNAVTELVAARRATPRVRTRPQRADDLLYWIEERERIRVRKEAGSPAPYTDDEILRTGRFCNVRRENDRVTRWITDHWRTPHADDPDLFLAMTVARLVNKAETLAALGYPLPWDPEHFLRVMAQCEKPYGSAYTITVAEGYPSKPVFQAEQIFGPLWEARKFIRPRAGDTLERFSTRLSDFKFLGSFYRGQIIADLKYVEPLRSAADWMTFAEPGPGSKPGLNLVLGRQADAPWTDNEWRGELRWLREAIAPDLDRLGLGDLHMQDLQNCCCEIFKFMRARTGERAVRRKYREGKAA